MSRVFLMMGESGTGKTTCALSGPKPINYYEFDAGSLERASAGLKLSEADIIPRYYYSPLTNLLDPGKISVGERGGIAPATVHKLEGWRELFWQFVADYLTALNGPGYPVIDTATKLWLCIRQAFLQEVQEAAGPEKERLNQLQYTEPNARHSQIIEAAKIKGKDLILLSHEKEQYLNDKPTGQIVPDGFREVSNMADCSLRFKLRDKKPVATIFKAGTGGLELLGMEIVEPTLDKLNTLLDAATTLRREGIPFEGMLADEVVQAAAMMSK